MTRRETYLDWNATAPLRPEAIAAVAAALAQGGNPSSVHRAGRAARQRIERAREAVASLVGAAPDGVVFVSGGTEANHLALLGAGRARILVSAVEHGSVLQAVPEAERIPVDRGRHRRSRRARRDAARPIRARRWSRSCWRITRPGSCSRPPHRRNRARAWRAVSLRRGAGRRQNSAGRRRDRRRSGQPVGAQDRRPAGDRRARREPAAPSRTRCCAAAGRSAAAAPAPRTCPASPVSPPPPMPPWPASPNTTGCAGCAIGLETAALEAVPRGAGDRRRRAAPAEHDRARPARHRGRDANHRARSRRRDGQRRRGLLVGQGRAEPCAERDGAAAPTSPAARSAISLGWSTTEADIDHFLNAWTALSRRATPRAA